MNIEYSKRDIEFIAASIYKDTVEDTGGTYKEGMWEALDEVSKNVYVKTASYAVMAIGGLMNDSEASFYHPSLA